MNKSLLVFALLSGPALANEGMWMPQQLPQLAKELQNAGLEIDPARLTQLTEYPLGAIISLGGCTASFVSDQGLVVTPRRTSSRTASWLPRCRMSCLRRPAAVCS
jgi:hypothetical protein